MTAHRHSQRLYGRRLAGAVRGFTLVELLVAMALGLVVVLAASSVYLNARETQRTLGDKAQIFENAKIAFELVGRDLEIAGYYPSERPGADASPGAQVALLQGYTNPDETTRPVAYNSGLYGCEAGRLANSDKGLACAAVAKGPDADGLVVNYYTDEAESLGTGNRADCLRQDPAGAKGGDPLNAARVQAASPVFISNRYSLSAVSMVIEGQTVNTFNLACWGNGNIGGGYQPMVVGFDQLRFFYLLGAAAGGQYVRANAVGDTGWGRVTAVRVCLMARSLQAARLQGATPYTITDCDGTAKTYKDGVERRVFSQVFPLKNYLP